MRDLPAIYVGQTLMNPRPQSDFGFTVCFFSVYLFKLKRSS